MITQLGGMSTVSNTTTSGWSHFVVAPDRHAVAWLRNGGYTLKTRYGVAGVAWQYDAVQMELHTNVTVPVGASAEVRHEHTLPAVAPTGEVARELSTVSEGGVLLWTSDGSAVGSHSGDGALDGVLKFTAVDSEGEWALSLVGSGRYTFTSQYE